MFLHRTWIKMSVTLLFLLCTTGCWSGRDIEKHSFIIGVALDSAETSKAENNNEQERGNHNRRNLLTITRQIINPQSSGTTPGEAKKQYATVSNTGDSIHQLSREILLREKTLLSSHQKVILIGDRLAKQIRLDNLVNQFVRDNETRDSCAVIIVRGEAKKALNVKTEGTSASEHLIDISENYKRVSQIIPKITLQKMTSKMNAHTSFLIQSIVPGNQDVQFSGAAVIDGGSRKLSGFLNPEQIEGINWLTGQGKGGVVKTYLDNNTLMVYEIISMKGHIYPKVQGDKISFEVEVHSVGRLSEDWLFPGNSFDNALLRKAELATKKEVTRLVQNTLHVLQKDLHADVAGFGEQLRIQQPRTWKKVRPSWDDTFSECPVSYSVKIKIQDYGNKGTKSTQKTP